MANEIAKEFHYDAFISYRHMEPDRFVAKNLHKELEKFKLPKGIEEQIKKNNPEAKTKISRVFRDEEELPLASNLADPIVEALKNSDYLIVICSPRLKESLWCRKEIETFIAMHGIDRVLAVLVEGEPEDSFPEELLTREKVVTGYDGKTTIVKEKIEPLAADVRAENDKARLKAVKSEKIRLIAPMFGLNYDDLKQRHKEQQTRRLITLISMVAAVCLMFAALSTYSAITFKKQKDEIQAQAQKIQSQSDELQLKSQELFDQNQKLLNYQALSLAQNSTNCLEEDDRYGAICNARAALTEYDGNTMPYTDEARLALTEALDPYNFGSNIKAAATIELGSKIGFMEVSDSGEVAAIYDVLGALSFWSMDTGKEICSIEDLTELALDKYRTEFVDDSHFVYTDKNGLSVVDLNTGSTGTFFEPEGFQIGTFSSLLFDPDSNNLYAAKGGDIYVFDPVSAELINTYSVGVSVTSGTMKAVPDGGLILAAGNIEGNSVYYIDKNGETVFSKSLGNASYRDALIFENVIYILYTDEFNVEDFFLGSHTEIKGFDLDSGEACLNISEKNIIGSALYNITEKDGEDLVIVGSNGISEYDIKTGENRDLYQEGICWSEAGEDFVAFMTKSYDVLNLYGHTTIGTSGYMNCNLKNVDMVLETCDGFLMHPTNRNSAVLYRENDNKDVVSIGSCNIKECESFVSQDARDIAAEYKLEKADSTEAVAFNYDKSLMSVTYVDGAVRIFNTSDMSIMSEFKCTGVYEYINYYCGEDSDGNTYWATENHGYGISPEGNVISNIYKLLMVDDDIVYMGFRTIDQFYAAPVYTTEDLLEIAEEY